MTGKTSAILIGSTLLPDHACRDPARPLSRALGDLGLYSSLQGRGICLGQIRFVDRPRLEWLQRVRLIDVDHGVELIRQ